LKRGDHSGWTEEGEDTERFEVARVRSVVLSTLSFVLRPGMGKENLGPRRPMVFSEVAAALGTRRLSGSSTLRQVATRRVQGGWRVGLIHAPLGGTEAIEETHVGSIASGGDGGERGTWCGCSHDLDGGLGTCKGSAVWVGELVGGRLAVRGRWSRTASRWQPEWWCDGTGGFLHCALCAAGRR
jgi:hypothetical protein